MQVWNDKTHKWEPHPHVIDVRQAANLVGIAPSTIYDAVKRGEDIGFPVIKAGRRYVVPRRPLEKLLGIEGEPCTAASSLNGRKCRDQ
jgi:predicted DNA-binding transcriptional regulator AlpA